MKCPVCNIDLKMADRQGIEIDYCPQCRGVWLDRGELDKIIERSAVLAPSAPPAMQAAPIPPQTAYPYGEREHYRYDDDDYRSHPSHPQHKKKKSFLGEVFDIFD